MINYSFLTTNEVQRTLSQNDEFLQNLSPLSLQMFRCRSVEDYRRILQGPNLALPFSQAEQTRIQGFMTYINTRLQELGLNFDLDIQFAKTSGMESMGMPYTRFNTIVLTFPYLQALAAGRAIPGVNMGEGLIAHEIFHVISRNYPEIREVLYGLYNFRRQPLTENIPQMFTNPDAPNCDYVVDVVHQGQQKTVRPVLALTGMDPMAMMSMDKQLYYQGRFIHRDQTNYLEVVGATSPLSAYHPEELCAENFRLLIEGQRFNNQQEFTETLRGL